MSESAANRASTRIRIVTGDITSLPAELGVEGIVNAANESLLGGGGVDGAIHRAAGPKLVEYNRTLGGCQTGLAKISPAFELEQKSDGRIKHIIHTVGPVWNGDAQANLGENREDELLGSCYQQSLELAENRQVHVLAFPSISTGVYGFPGKRAAQIAVRQVIEHLQDHAMPEQVVFCCFAEDDARIYREVVEDEGP